jgi:hypothetical protein
MCPLARYPPPAAGFEWHVIAILRDTTEETDIITNKSDTQICVQVTYP